MFTSQTKSQGCAMSRFPSNTTLPGYSFSRQTGALTCKPPRPVFRWMLRLSRSLPVMAQNSLEVL